MFNFTIGHGDGFSYAFLMIEDNEGNSQVWNAIFMAHSGKVVADHAVQPF